VIVMSVACIEAGRLAEGPFFLPHRVVGPLPVVSCRMFLLSSGRFLIHSSSRKDVPVCSSATHSGVTHLLQDALPDRPKVDGGLLQAALPDLPKPKPNPNPKPKALSKRTRIVEHARPPSTTPVLVYLIESGAFPAVLLPR
jgi:hypothetical protein